MSNKFGIKHTLKIEEDGVTISGQITDIEWGEFFRGYGMIVSNKDLCISSSFYPEIISDSLYVWGDLEGSDNDTIAHIYDTPQEAQAMMDFINEYTITEEGDAVYLDDGVIKKAKSREPKEGERLDVLHGSGTWNSGRTFMYKNDKGKFVCYSEKKDNRYFDCYEFSDVRKTCQIIEIKGKRYDEAEVLERLEGLKEV